MTTPKTDNLAKTYFDEQTARVIRNLTKIVDRDAVAVGRTIPDTSDLSIHDGKVVSASVLFLDISKFSARPSGTSQQQQNLLRILALFFTEMFKIVEDHTGTVEKNTGDGLMAYFVNDATLGTAQKKAVACALTMFYAADNLINPLLVRSGIEPIKFRICVDHGPITVAKIGVPRGFNGIVAIGTTANIAAKMLAHADPDELLIGTDVINGLPPLWVSNYVQAKKFDTGWIYTATNDPYIFWKYIGRWSGPKS